MMQVAETARWPTWRGDRYGDLARYVSGDALAGLDFVLHDAEPRRQAATGTRCEANYEIVQALYHKLAGHKIRYSVEPWSSEGQRIRYPRWLDRGSGTCLDFATTFAAACIDARLSPVLVIARDLGGAAGASTDHAFVIVDLDPDWGPALPNDRLADLGAVGPVDDLAASGDDEEEDEDLTAGVAEWVGPELSELATPGRARRFLAVDCTGAAESLGWDFDQAVDKALGHLRGGGTYILVDVLARQGLPGFSAFVPPAGDGFTISRALPSFPEFTEFPSRVGALRALEAASGRVVISGRQGMGKSMLAHRRAATADDGCGWFLPATDLETYVTSLANVLALEDGLPVEDIDMIARKERAAAAKARLDEATGPWVVVLDNANCDPAELLVHLPIPDAERGQVLIVTTTNLGWASAPGFTAIALDDLDDDDVRQLLGADPAMLALVSGRPLLLNSFATLAGAAGNALLDAARRSGPSEDEMAGPRLLWDVARGLLSAEGLEVAARLAWLPPDDIPVDAVLGSLVEEAAARAAELRALGLVTMAGAGSLGIHRLYVRAIRDDLMADPAQVVDVLRELLETKAAWDLLDDSGDQATTDAIIEVLTSSAVAEWRPGLSSALRSAARLQEVHGRIADSGATYDLVCRRLMEPGLPDGGEERAVLADCLHGRARVPYQQSRNDPEALRGALADCRQAISLKEGVGDELGVARSRALEGLILRALAGFEAPEARLELMEQALVIIEESSATRRRKLGDFDPEVARSVFNLGGGRITLAQQDELSRAAEHLGLAQAAYEEALGIRKALYRRGIHPHIAACRNGLALTAYYRAMLCATTPEERLGDLREATEHAHAALADRQQLDGAMDGVDSMKSAALLAKVLLAREALSPAVETGAACRDFERELPRFLAGDVSVRTGG